MTELQVRASPPNPGVKMWRERRSGNLLLKRPCAASEYRINARMDFAEALASEGGRFPEGPRWSIEHWARNGAIEYLAVGGLEQLSADRWGAWAYTADLSRNQWLFAADCATTVLRWADDFLGHPTIQAVPAPTPQAVRLLKRIGFVDVGEPYMVWEG